jgi:Putative prokaryotic signal transducing protein
MADQLKILTTVSNEFEAQMVVGLLSDAGIHSMQELGGAGAAGRVGGGGARDVYVAEQDLDRAREVLDQSAPD